MNQTVIYSMRMVLQVYKGFMKGFAQRIVAGVFVGAFESVFSDSLDFSARSDGRSAVPACDDKRIITYTWSVE